MKQAQRLRAQVIAMFGSLLVFGLLTASLYWLVYYRIGPDFFQGLSYLYATGSLSYALPFSYLNAANLIAFGARLPGLYLLANVLVMLSYLVSIITWPFIVVMSLFAWSFDRILPAKIAQVDSKGNPWVAVLVATAVSEAYVALVVANPSIGAWLAYQIFGWALAWVVVGLAAAIFPYRRRDLFEASPPPVKRRFLGIPLITLLGLASALFSGIMAYGVISPVFIGTVNPFFLTLTLLLFLIGLGIYYASYVARKRQGIPMELLYKTLPPE